MRYKFGYGPDTLPRCKCHNKQRCPNRPSGRQKIVNDMVYPNAFTVLFVVFIAAVLYVFSS